MPTPTAARADDPERPAPRAARRLLAHPALPVLLVLLVAAGAAALAADATLAADAHGRSAGGAGGVVRVAAGVLEHDLARTGLLGLPLALLVPLVLLATLGAVLPAAVPALVAPALAVTALAVAPAAAALVRARRPGGPRT
ncbi:hypothetical protein [Kineococcus gypseus]|uniref:hypothetical protein n=1 Tax=Kineococcus gypseus TaxID=1637102 RepID=UPI003D7CACE8